MNLKANTLFWTRLGMEVDPPRCDAQRKQILFNPLDEYEKFANFHRQLDDNGIKLHTTILASGWLGPDHYDYTLTDYTLDKLFEQLPKDSAYLPRVKLNAPVEWLRNYPEEAFVYYGGADDPDIIRHHIGGPQHDLLGWDSPDGCWHDKRPNVGGWFSNQSFASKRWLQDASEALRRLIEHVKSGPYGDRIIGWHICYGASGETCMWGRFGKPQYGDYSRVFHNEFLSWAIRTYGQDVVAKRWNGNDTLPPPDRRRECCQSLSAFQRKNPEDVIVRDLDTYLSDLNSSIAEHFCRIAKQAAPHDLTGVFYGYILECHNANYTGWLGLDRLLESPHVDFFAAPTSYFRRTEGEPGGFIAPAQSIQLKKIWVDELDVRTYLASPKEDSWIIPKDCTEAVMFREMCKNLAIDAGYWWMDLRGGWYDSDFIRSIIAKVERTAAAIRAKQHRSLSDVLFLVDEQAQIQHTESETLFRLYAELRRELALTGTLIDTYRLKDLPLLDLSQYKLIIWGDCPSETEAVIPEHCYQLRCYLDCRHQLSEATGDFPTGDITFSGVLTGRITLPATHLPRIQFSHVSSPLAYFSDGSVAMHQDKRTFYAALPFLRCSQLRQLVEYAGCRTYADAPCTVYGDNRFIATFPKHAPATYTFSWEIPT